MFTVFDIETTGLISYSCDIIQLAYCTFTDSGVRIDSDNLYFYYKGMHWDQEVADKSHHFSLNFLQQYEKDFTRNLIKAYTLLNGANVVGHNMHDFDAPFVTTWLKRMGLTDFMYGEIQDTMKSATVLNKGHRISLINLCNKLDITPDVIRQVIPIYFPNEKDGNPHNAVYDVTATALVYFSLVRQGYLSWNRLKTVQEKKPEVLENLDVPEPPKPVVSFEPVVFIHVGSRYFPVVQSNAGLVVREFSLTDPGDTYVYEGFERQGNNFVGTVNGCSLSFPVIKN